MAPRFQVRGRSDTVLLAAQYVRMSTEYQKYSPENQKLEIAGYAQAHRIEIIRTYEDAGRSGLTLRDRPALCQLLLDVQKQERDFNVLLVYDISRWGRFQDVDESAHYEYLCRCAGVQVIYCKEPFENDCSPASNIIKTLKRAMAGEYSRELSAKVFQGQCRAAGRGFRQGAAPGYGLRRLLVDDMGTEKIPLRNHERKNIQSDHVTIIHGPANEVALIRRVYEWFIEGGISTGRIATRLNDFGLRNAQGLPWRRDSITQLLTAEKYVGNNVYNRTSVRLNTPRICNPPSEWVRAVGAFRPVVSAEEFNAVQRIRDRRAHRLSNEDLLEGLSALRDRLGRLSAVEIGKDPFLPGQHYYRRRFGSLTRAYKAIGFETNRNYEYLNVVRDARHLQTRLCEVTVARLTEAGHHVVSSADRSVICVNGELRLRVTARAASATIYRHLHWNISWPTLYPIDLLVVARADRLAKEFLDFFVFPKGSLGPEKLTILTEENRSRLNMFRHLNLKVLLTLAERSPLEAFNACGTIPDNEHPSGPYQDPESEGPQQA